MGEAPNQDTQVVAMPNTLKTIIKFSLILFIQAGIIQSSIAKNTFSCDTEIDATVPTLKNPISKSILCDDSITFGKRQFTLEYDYKKRILSITSDKPPSRVTLEKVSRGHNPELVGSDDYIRFLPVRLQAYRSQGKLLYLFSYRTNAGNGMGQCGAGTEEFLNVLDITGKIPKKIATFHINSCSDNIELSNTDTASRDKLSAFSINEEEQLQLQFLTYDDRNEDSPTAILLDDFKKLRFIKKPTTNSGETKSK